MPSTAPRLAALMVAFLLAGCSGSDAVSDPDPGPGAGSARSAGAVREWDGVAYPVWEAEAYAGAEATTALGEIAATGASAVTIIPTWYVDDTSTSLPHRDPEQTASDASLRAAIVEAHRVGLRVILKPHVDVEDDTDRAEIVPVDPAAWFNRYRDLMVGYANLATETGVEMLSVGTELAGTMDRPAEWADVIGAIRSVYSGPLTYAANFDGYTDVPFWDRLDDIGVDAYFELSTEPTTDVDRLVTAWGPVLDELDAFAAGLGKPVIFTEAGYASQVGSTTQPWNWEISEERSDAEQAAGYEALFTAVADRSWIDGVQWWMWDDLADTGEDQALDYTPHGKAAERVLRSQWAVGDER